MKINWAIDSGAFSIFTKYSRRKGTGARGADFSFYSTPKFAEYLARYATWVKEQGPQLDYAVTLDVIYDPARTYSIWRELCSATKPFTPMPVVHYGEDPRWLKKYLGRTDYIGLGGVGGGDITYRQYFTWLRDTFKFVPRDTRMHGFAVTQHQAMADYPWHSVDSATPWWAASHGKVVLLNGGKAIQVNFSRSYGDRNHFNRLGPTYRKTILAGLEQYGLTPEQLTGQGYAARAFINYLRINQLAETRGIKYYLSGSSSGGLKSLAHFLALLESKVKQKQFYYLGTFFSLYQWNKVNDYIHNAKLRRDILSHVENQRFDCLPEPPLSSSALAKLHSRPDPFLFYERPRLRIRR